MNVILDTNILIEAVKSKIDIFEQLKGNKIFTVLPVIKELNKNGTQQQI